MNSHHSIHRFKDCINTVNHALKQFHYRSEVKLASRIINKLSFHSHLSNCIAWSWMIAIPQFVQSMHLYFNEIDSTNDLSFSWSFVWKDSIVQSVIHHWCDGRMNISNNQFVWLFLHRTNQIDRLDWLLLMHSTDRSIHSDNHEFTHAYQSTCFITSINSIVYHVLDQPVHRSTKNHRASACSIVWVLTLFCFWFFQ